MVGVQLLLMVSAIVVVAVRLPEVPSVVSVDVLAVAELVAFSVSTLDTLNLVDLIVWPRKFERPPNQPAIASRIWVACRAASGSRDAAGSTTAPRRAAAQLRSGSVGPAWKRRSP